jgi:hypothetical protein
MDLSQSRPVGASDVCVCVCMCLASACVRVYMCVTIKSAGVITVAPGTSSTPQPQPRSACGGRLVPHMRTGIRVQSIFKITYLA